jgi:hypothetical protein
MFFHCINVFGFFFYKFSMWIYVYVWRHWNAKQGSLPSFDLYFQRLELDLISLEICGFVAIFVAKKEKVLCFILPIHFMSKYSYSFFIFCCKFAQDQEAINDVFGVFTLTKSQIQKELLMFCFHFIICWCILIFRFFCCKFIQDKKNY